MATATHQPENHLAFQSLKELTAYARTVTPGQLTPEQTAILFPPMTPLAQKSYTILWRTLDTTLSIARFIGIIDDFTSEDGYWPTLPYRFERIIVDRRNNGSYRRYKIGRLYVGIETRGYQKRK